MKKLLLLSAVAAFLLAAPACTQKSGVADATTFSEKIANCSNPDSINAYVDQAKAYAEKLVKEGKVKEAQEYLTKIEPVVKEKAPAAASAITTAKEILNKAVEKLGQGKDNAAEAVSNATKEVADKANEAGDAVAGKAQEVSDAVADKASDVKDAVADKTKEVTDATVDKAKEAAHAVGDKANDVKDTVKDKIDDLKKK